MKKQFLPTLEEAFTGTLYGTSPNGDQIQEIDPSELIEITDQPFHAYESDKLSQLADSIRENGQQQPCIVRKKEGQYIVLAGRNRKRACELAGCKVKCIVRECTDAEADLILTDTNLYQRHELLPSELALAYKMQKAAYEARGEKKSTAAIADTYGETIKTIQRYIKLADLNKDLLAFVDSGRIPVMGGVMLTDTIYANNQQLLANYLQSNSNQKVSLKQAEGLLALEQAHNWYNDILDDFFTGKIDLSEPDKTAEKPELLGNSKIQNTDGHRLNVSPDDEKKLVLEQLSSLCPTAPGLPAGTHEVPAVVKHVCDSSGNLPLPNQETIFSEDDIADIEPAALAGYQRLTHERVNGIKTGYWSDANKEELVQRLAAFENAYPNGPKR